VHAGTRHTDQQTQSQSDRQTDTLTAQKKNITSFLGGGKLKK